MLQDLFFFTLVLEDYRNMVIHKSFPDFVLFLYIHMAHADGEPHEAERKIILEKMKRLFQSIDLEKKYDEASEEYANVKSQDVSTIIRDTFRQFADVKFAVKYRVYTDMYDIIHADGIVDESETAALDELKEIIDMGSLRSTRA